MSIFEAPIPFDRTIVFELPTECDESTVSRLFKTISEAEKAKALKFVFKKDFNAFVVTRSILRIILSQANECSSSSLKFDYNEWGKPCVSGSKVQFNLSHAGSRALIAISPDGPIGVDIEEHRTMDDIDLISLRYFVRNEIESILKMKGQEKIDTFFRFWVRKEAFIKFVGRGLSIPLNSFSVFSHDASELRVNASNSGVCTSAFILDLPVKNEYSASVAVEKTKTVEYFSCSHTDIDCVLRN